MPDSVYKGMQRPAMWWGVPIRAAIPVHLVGVFIAVVTTSILDNPWALAMLAVLIPIHLFMREVTRTKPQRWRQVGLWIKFRIIRRDFSSRFWESSTYGVRSPR